MEGLAWQVQWEGQSPSAAQTIGFTWQAMRPVGVQLQLGAGRGAASESIGGKVAASGLAASAAAVGGPEVEGVALPEGDELEEPPELVAAPPEPLQPQLCSGTQTKPSPQSEATWHAARYRGTHELTVVDVQVDAGEGTGHPPSLEQAGAPGAVHVELVDVWHTMSVAQSTSAWHAPGTHPFTTVGVQAGGGGQLAPGAHAGEAHAVPPTTAQVNP